ncbi:DUF1266 domain-containing protein [Oceanirhabdus sp. W0125-5]|uniref:DUF1266 domain-containing protein n=1 Tax=Oceanirhabdus sp. W0125-5 TaxID=2999116 RepID=UPI0022F347E6|nr:DUF1266 domain-containing protein [Oceanirhabdus sp. W0125-5]WBW96331.1 DUF1266 domain-containing protein [Oceanirhabdus sp. W0125-5]
MKIENNQQLWALYLGMLSFLGNKLDMDVLKKHKKIWKLIKNQEYELPEAIIYGAPEVELHLLKNSQVNIIQNFVEQKHGIKNSNRFFDEVDRLIEGSGFTREASREIQRIKLLSNAYINEILNDKNNKAKKEKYETIFRNIDSVTSSGLYAYDLANAISLCRLGGVYGYLNKEEVLEKVNNIAGIIYDKYYNYEDFGVACRLGYELEVLKLKDNNAKIDRLDQHSVMNQVGYNIWTKLPWPREFNIM